MSAPTAFALERRDATGDGHRPYGEPYVAEGHPPVPVEAMPRLRTRTLDRAARAGEPPRWWPHDGSAWAAVLDLHKRGEHEAADGLARLLHWCDERSRPGEAIWYVREVAS